MKYFSRQREFKADLLAAELCDRQHMVAALKTLAGVPAEQGECWEAMNELQELLNIESQGEVPEPQCLQTIRRILQGAPVSVALVAADLAETQLQQAYAMALVERGLDGPYRIQSPTIQPYSRETIQEDQEAAAKEYAVAQTIAADTVAIAKRREGETERMTFLSADFERCVGQLAIVKQQWMTASNHIESLRNNGEVLPLEMVEQLRQRSEIVSEVRHGDALL